MIPPPLSKSKPASRHIAVVGLGYVGLPLAVEFGKVFETLGFDSNEGRIEALGRFCDSNRELTASEIRSAKKLRFGSNASELKKCDFFVVAVPTPVDASRLPDLSFVEAATRTVGRHLRKGAIVVFEPTVYPGVTEEVCVPILEKESGLKFKKDFMVGYSPERMSPGDKERTVSKIVKIVSGCCDASLDEIADVYGRIIGAGVFRAASIKTAEAAKVIENTQRDLNIALMNELALIFHRMGIDTRDVIEAAGTKWNFMKFYPGLVGGHCIGVDPYYLTYKAEQLGYHPQVILSGRRINDLMGKHVAEQTVKHVIAGGKAVRDSRVLVLGVTFKENVADVRNSRVADLVRKLEEYGMKVKVCDPHADPKKTKEECGVVLCEYDKNEPFDAVVIAVAHAVYRKKITVRSLEKQLTGSRGVVIDVNGMFRARDFKGTRILHWRL